MNLLDERKLIIEIEDQIKEIPKIISSKLQAKLLSENKIIIHYKSHEAGFSDILNILHQSDLKITDFETKRADLERVFKYLIRK
jgi:ABC-type multidrug transport system ATPase subunit